MHFRPRKNVIQLIRTTYNEDKKKGENVIVATVRLNKPLLSAEVRSKLTAEEITAFETWLATQHHIEMLRSELAALTLAENIMLAEAWFEREGNTVASQKIASDIINVWQNFRRVLAKKTLLD